MGNEPVGTGVLDELAEKSGIYKQYMQKHYVLLSKSGLTRELRERAMGMCNVQLIYIKKLYELK